MITGQRVIAHNGLGWVSDKFKLIYLGIPKTASTSMRIMLNVSKGNNCIIRFNNLSKYNSEYKRFTILREPISRFVSGVFEDIKRQESSKKIRNLEKLNNPINIMSSYLKHIEENGFTEVHTAPQCKYFFDLKGTPYDYDYVLIFERLKDDFNEMCKKENLNINLQHRHQGDKRSAKIVMEYINSNPEILERIKLLYKEDLELYNKYL